MTHSDPGNDDYSGLGRMTESLSRDIDPGRDLWPEISARISSTPLQSSGVIHWWQSPIISAASILVAVLAVTFALTRPEPGTNERLARQATPASTSVVLDAGFLADRKRLANRVEGRMADLSPELQALVRQNLDSIHGSLTEISLALADDPENADLQDLLISTYEQELRVMSDISRLPDIYARRIDL